MSREGRRSKRSAPGDGLVPFGDYLRRERELREITLQEVVRETKIGRTFLESIESGSVEGLPPLTFVKGFLRSYASYVGLDPNDVILRFEQALMGKSALGFLEGRVLLKGRKITWRMLRLPLLLLASAGALALALQVMPSESRREIVDERVMKPLSGGRREDPEQLKRRLKEELGLIDRSNLTPTPSPSAAPIKPGTSAAGDGASGHEPQAEPKPAPAGPAPSGTPTASPSPPSPTAKKHALVVEGKGPSCWVRVIPDGGPPKDTRIEKGQKGSWEANERFQLVLGDAGGVKVFFDGREVAIPEKPGAVLRLALPEPPAPKDGAGGAPEPGPEPDAED